MGLTREAESRLMDHAERYARVEAEACRIFGVSPKELHGVERMPRMVAARAAICYVCQLSASDMSTGQLAQLLRGSANARATVIDARPRWIRAMGESQWRGVNVDVQAATVALIRAWCLTASENRPT